MRRGLTGILVLLAAFSVSCVQADTDPLRSVTRSLRAGDTQTALRELSSLPAEGDVRARFLRGTTLAAAGRVKEAIKIFEGLIADHPKLPEPYNNLAALYARENRLDKAKEVLERAIRTDESYATVYENLSAIYVEMARDSYVKALRLEDKRRPPDLQLLYALNRSGTPTVAAGTGASEPAQPAVPVKTAMAESEPAQPAATKGGVDEKASAQGVPEATPAQKPAAPKKVPSESTAAKMPEPPAQEKPVAKAVEPPAAEPVQVAASEKASEQAPAKESAEKKTAGAKPTASAPSMDTPQPVAKSGSGGVETSPAQRDSGSTLQASVEKTLDGWAEAWSNQQVDRYLAYYVADFAPNAGQSHDSWVAERRQRLSKPDKISITLDSFDVRRRTPDEVVVRLWQRYRSDRYQDKTWKRFVLVRKDGNWLIQSEKSLKIIR